MLISQVTAFIRVSALNGIAEFAATQNLAIEQLLEAVELPSDALQYPESFIPYRKFAALLDAGAQRTDNPLFGLQFGLHQGVAALGPMFYLIRNAANVGEALNELSRYFHLHSSSSRLRVTQEGEHALFHYDADDVKDVPSHRIVVELVVGTATHLMRALLGSRWQPQALLLQHAPLRPPQAYHRLLGITPQFNAPYNAWVFDAKLLQAPLGGGDPELRKLIQQHLDNLDRMAVQELPSYVSQLLRDLLPNGRTSIEQIAEYMDLGPRTLQRYLAEEGTSFQQLLDETRQSMAQRYLTDSTLNLTHMAAMLGYSELSAFTRAFRRWYGMSPKQWRVQQAGGSRQLLRSPRGSYCD
ncbi:AraC family transcriptional regulator [Pseudomonas sp. 5P_3.1_Bac2]|uniref:AraC-like transcriptional regulator QhpR n=1 Tax=Pseudomonas sp. 5P_3.1_Bac2 TaxID=2971617 RepID=UPI0021CA128C|nr:AraC family transcriptional regulator [Pseudomonas sp. 5P_3.1_Bac2]MCU1715682.1 AraC family transcriptional regulator [Pseudomonas sp. 5P_3.1_Bac2]